MSFIKTSSSRRVVGLIAIAAITLAFTATSGKSSAAANEPSEQVVFSGIGVALEGDFQSFVGFWIWCQPEGNGPYVGACRGAMYVYRFGHTAGVHGFVTEEPDGTYTMHVFSNHEGDLSATLHNVSPELNHGPNNTVEFDVTVAEGTAHGESNTAVVDVTGPED